jgi:hypothetical protein
MAITDFDQQQADLRERRKRAREGQQFNAIPGQMVSGHYVAPHFTQVLAQGLRGYNAIQDEQKADQELKDLTGKRTQAMTDALRGFTTNMTPVPEQRTPMQADAFDEADRASLGANQNLTAVTPERKADPMAAFASLANSPDSAMRSAATTGMINMQAEQAKLAQAQAQQAKQMQLLQSAQTPQAALQAGVPYEMVKNYYESKNLGRDQVDFKDVGGQLVPVTKYGDSPQGVQPLTKTGNPFSDLVVRDAAGNIVPNAPLAGVKTGIAKASATTVDARNFNTQESEQSKSYGKTLGEIRGKITQAGFDAPKQLAKLDRMETLLQGIDGGAAAPTLAQIASTANSFGIKLDENLGPKEAAIALAVNMASGLREPGTGPMTDKDFDNFLKQVPDLSKSAEGRKAIMTTLRAATQRDLQAAQFARDYAKQNKGVIDDNFFDAMAGFYAERPVVNIPMPATNARGSQFRVVR